MIEVVVTIGDSEYSFEFQQEPTEQQLTDAMDTIGGRPKRD